MCKEVSNIRKIYVLSHMTSMHVYKYTQLASSTTYWGADLWEKCEFVDGLAVAEKIVASI